MALLVRWAASGENAVVFSDEEFQALVEERGNTIKALKLELASRGFGSRFCLRLLHAGEHLEVGDDVVIVPPLVLKMVKLAFLPADEGRDQEFLDACQDGDLQAVANSLHQHQDPNTADIEGYTGLHAAAQNGDLELVRLLLEAEASCNQACSGGGTALHDAAANGHLEMVRLLLQAGATCDHAVVLGPVAGWTSLHWAARGGYLDVVQLLVEFGAARDARTRDGETPVELAAKHGFQDVVDWFNHEPAKRLKTEHGSES